MRSAKSPAVATWLLEHLQSGPRNDHITGDLMEAYQSGRSRAWYWRQVLAVIIVSFYEEIMVHPVLALRAVAIGWACSLLYVNTVAPYLFELARRLSIVSRRFPVTPSAIILYTVLMVANRAVSGWIVARLHRPHRTGMVLVFAASVLIFQLRVLPLIWFEGANTLTNTRFLPYLTDDLEALVLPPLAIALGGLWTVAPNSESRDQQQRATA